MTAPTRMRTEIEKLQSQFYGDHGIKAGTQQSKAKACIQNKVHMGDQVIITGWKCSN